MKNILLPLGISFFTFQQLSYILDSYSGKTGKEGYKFIEYALFISFFPQLVAGPIVLHDELIPSFRDDSKKRVDFDNLAHGIIMFTLDMIYDGRGHLTKDNYEVYINWIQEFYSGYNYRFN